MNISALLSGIHQAIEEVKVIEPAYKEAQHHVHMETLHLKYLVSEDEMLRKQMIAHLYWFENYVSVASIGEAFGITLDQIREIAFKEYPDITCSQCNALLINPKLKSIRRSLICVSCASINRTSETMQEVQARLAKARKVRETKEKKAERDKASRTENAERKKRKQENTEERIAELRAMSYREYLQTPEWQKKRYYILKRANNHCQVCNTSKGTLDVHHRTYERLGHEHYTDLIVLCRSCHGTFHKNGKLAKQGA